MTEEKKESQGVSRREFLKDAGLVVGGAAIGSTVLLAACGGESTTETVTKTVTTTAPGGTATITKTESGGTVTSTTAQEVKVSKFVCPCCGAELDSLSALQAHFEAEHGGETPVDEDLTELTINGKVYTLKIQPNWELQYVLHDKLGLIGAKTFCERGACGSCTVNIDGRPVLSCMVLACECEGKNIETVEGIAAANHPLIDAYIKYDCMQCGYCTPGFVVTAKALLDRNPDPNEDEIKQALAGNLCRCGTYPQHPKAILEAAEILRGGG